MLLKSVNDCLVLVVEDDAINRLVIESSLAGHYKVVCAEDGETALIIAYEQVPDLIVLDINLPGINGIEVCRQLKADPVTAGIPVIFITATLSPQLEDSCWGIGASDFITKPIVCSTLLHRVSNHLHNKLRFEYISQLSFIDVLTGTYNRNFLAKEVPKLIGALIRNAKPLSVLVLDIDFFKQFNDTYGHLEGDNCLLSVAQILKNELLRPQDILIRYGGEEFLVLLPDTDLSGAEFVANRLCSAIVDHGIPNEKAPLGKVTASIGCAMSENLSLPDSDLKSTISQADKALYSAKKSGRNRVCVDT